MRSNNRGFTIVELLMAMAIFSFVMIVIVAAFTQLMSGYRQGVTNQKTQSLSREILVEMTRVAHDGSTLEVSPDGRHVCFGDAQYYYDASNGNLYLGRKIDSCTTTDPNGRNLVADDLEVLKFKVDPKSSAGSDPVVLGASLQLTIATRTDELRDDSQTCDPTEAGSQYCSVTSIETAIGLRGE